MQAMRNGELPHCPLAYSSLVNPNSGSTNTELFPHLFDGPAFQKQTKRNPPTHITCC